MNHSLFYATICSLLLVSLAGVCIAAESSSNIVYIQGGSSTVTNGSDGNMVITIQDVIPYVHMTDGDKSHLTLIEQLTKVTYPVNAAMILSGAGNESVSMVTINNLTESDGNVLTLQVTPMKYYDGEALKDFANTATPFEETKIEKAQSFSIYIEVKQKVLENY